MIFTATLLKRWRTGKSKHNCCKQSMESIRSFWAGMRSGSCCLTTCLQASSNLTSRYEMHRLAIDFGPFKSHLLIHLVQLLIHLIHPTCIWLMHHQCNLRPIRNASCTVDNCITCVLISILHNCNDRCITIVRTPWVQRLLLHFAVKRCV